jgi:hypothetical protein
MNALWHTSAHPICCSFTFDFALSQHLLGNSLASQMYLMLALLYSLHGSGKLHYVFYERFSKLSLYSFRVVEERDCLINLLLRILFPA